MLTAGVIGYVMRTLGFPILPLVLALVLGGIVERNYRRSIDLSYGDPMIFLQDPVSAGLLGLTVFFVGLSIFLRLRKNAKDRKSSAETVEPHRAPKIAN